MKKQYTSIIILMFFFYAANAQIIIYTDVKQDVKLTCRNVGCSQQYNLDLNNDGVNDFTLSPRKYSSFFCGGNYDVYVFIATLDSNKVVSTNNYANNLLPNSVIDNQDVYNDVYSSLSLRSSVWQTNNRGSYYLAHLGQWSSSSDGYIGLKLKKGSNTYYGWVRL